MQIQAYERRWFVPLFEQAQRNLGTRGYISSIMLEHGYLDGEDLWQVDPLGVLLVVVDKTNMAVTQDAQALARRERVQMRERVVRLGHGKTAAQERLRTELVGIEGVTTYDDDGIFHLAELAILSGVRLHRLPSYLGSRQAILQL